MSNKIQQFLDADISKLEEIIEKHPKQIPINVIADLLGCGAASLQTACLENGLFGFGWRKPGKVNHGFCVPTGVFIRWYTKGIYIGNSEVTEQQGKEVIQ